MNTFKIMYFLSKGDKSDQDYNYEQQKQFLDSFTEPKSDIERSFFQYKCQNFFRSTTKNILFDCVSFIILIPLIPLLLIRGGFTRFINKENVIGEFLGFEDLIPDELSSEFTINNDLWNKGFSLSCKDLVFIYQIIKVGYLNPYFILKSIIKVSNYSYNLKTYKPDAIFVHGEYSFCSSLLTKYCEDRHVEHINAMHGEKTFYIGHAFFRYSRCYVWDKYYIDLLCSLRAYSKQFIISTPLALKIDLEHSFDKNVYSDYKYYLQEYDEKHLQMIVDSMNELKKSGRTVHYRPHPRFSNVSLLEKYVDDSEIERPVKVNVSKSVASCEHVVGYSSTVLLQGYLNGRHVILDDIAYYEENAKLKEFRYILSYKEDVDKLSNIIKYENTKNNKSNSNVPIDAV